MSVVEYSDKDTSVAVKEDCNCTWFSTCAPCKDLPRRFRQAEKDKLKAYKLAQSSQNYQKTLDKLDELDLSAFSSIEINYKNSKQKGKYKVSQDLN